MRTRYSFDIGTNSIGWAVWRTGRDLKGVFGEKDAPVELLGAGVRLFKDGRNPKDGQSLATMRRIPRQARKRRDRFVLRREALVAALVKAKGMTPPEPVLARIAARPNRNKPSTPVGCARIGVVSNSAG